MAKRCLPCDVSVSIGQLSEHFKILVFVWYRKKSIEISLWFNELMDGCGGGNLDYSLWPDMRVRKSSS